MGGEYNRETNTITLDPTVAKELQEGLPPATWMVAHEIAHSAQDVNDQSGWGDATGFPDGLNNENFRNNVEGQNDLVTAITMSSLYGKPTSQDTAVDMQNQYEDLLHDKTFFETGASVSGGGSGIVEIGYGSQSEYWAGVATAMAQVQGGTPYSNLITAHDQGADPQYTHNILMNLFPNQMSSGGYYAERQEGGFLGIGATTIIDKQFPPPREVNQWLREQYGISSDEAFRQMLEEAAGQ